MKINEVNPGNVYEGFLLIKEVRKGVARNGSEYLSLTLADNTSEIKAMVWESNKEKESFFTASKIIKVEGEITEYQGRKQIKLRNVRDINEGDPVNILDFVEVSPVRTDLILDNIWSTISDMDNEVIKRVTEHIFKTHEAEFKRYPAAKSMHHAYNGGLAYHTYQMLNLAKTIVELYPLFNKDLLFAGVILHDLMKVKEYDFDNITVNNYTLKGKLIGHIVLMIEEIDRVANELEFKDKEEVLLLKHIVNAHHGKGEWGSPVNPQTPEALALHMIDLLDSRFEMLKKGLKGVGKGEFTNKIFGLDNSSFYNHNLNKA